MNIKSLSKLPPDVILKKIKLKTNTAINSLACYVTAKTCPMPSEKSFKRELVVPFDECADNFLENFRLLNCDFKENKDVRRIIDFKKWKNRTVESADEVCLHKIKILGTQVDVGDEIQWSKDYVSGMIWPLKYYKKIIRTYNNGSDIKYPWELSRFHHAVILGKAYILTKDEMYAKELIHQILDWIESNPPYFGVNWTCAMEVSIRIANFILAAYLVRESPNCNKEFIKLFMRCVLSHARFIYKNLEYNYQYDGNRYEQINGNHYMADIIGLLYISLTFQEFREMQRWLSFSKEELFKEIRLQIQPDGVHWEFCPNYHRLILEMILYSIIFLKRMGIIVPEDINHRIIKMLHYLESYTKPDGSFPLVGDIDNGRFHILGKDHLISHNHLLPVGACIYGKEEFACRKFNEDSLWLFGIEGYESYKKLYDNNRKQNKRSVLFPSGFYIQKYDKLHLFVSSNKIGMKGFCGHSHNDTLSFELYAYDKNFLTDCGSYVYTRFPEWRNKFRSINCHNTVIIDNKETNEIIPDQLFGIESKIDPVINNVESKSKYEIFDAQYKIKLISNEIIHRRAFYFNKEKKFWIIKDRLSGTGMHSIKSCFHFDKDIQIIIENKNTIRTMCEKGSNLILRIFCNEKYCIEKSKEWVSRIYGKKDVNYVVEIFLKSRLPVNITYLLYPVYHENEDHNNPELQSENDAKMVWKLEDELNKIANM